MTRRRLTNPLEPAQMNREAEKMFMLMEDFQKRYRWLFDMAYYKRQGGADRVSGTSDATSVEIVANPDLGDKSKDDPGNIYAKRRRKLARALEKLHRAVRELESAVQGDLAEGTPGVPNVSGRILSRSEIRQLKNRQERRAEQGGGFGVS